MSSTRLCESLLTPWEELVQGDTPVVALYSEEEEEEEEAEGVEEEEQPHEFAGVAAVAPGRSIIW